MYSLSMAQLGHGWYWSWFKGDELIHINQTCHSSILDCYKDAVLWTTQPECPEGLMLLVFRVKGRPQ